jgi:hypothetical protein
MTDPDIIGWTVARRKTEGLPAKRQAFSLVLLTGSAIYRRGVG